MERKDVVTVGVAAGFGVIAYEALYKPWKRKQDLAAEIAVKAAAIQKAAPGMSVKDAIAKAGATACAAYAQKYKVNPELAGPLCNVASKLAIEGAILAGKGIKKGAQLAVKGAKVVVKDVGKGAVAVGKGIGVGAKAAFYTAPKAVLYTAPKKAVGATLRAGAKTLKKLKFW
jgi:hypothetical protein